MHESRCSKITAELTRHLTDGAPLETHLLNHVRGCPSCKEVLERAEALKALLESSAVIPVSESEVSEAASIAAATKTVVELNARQRRLLKVLAAVVLFAATFITWTGVSTMRRPFAVTAITVLLFAGPLVLAILYARSTPTAGRRGIYKRIARKELSGVCRGLSEAFGIPVWILRMMFVGLVFLKGLGLWLYLLLGIVMPVHPEDRMHLMRFRIARWFRKFSATA
jgi:phage shock protein PspC (stress-responsive transcriptional regulator)